MNKIRILIAVFCGTGIYVFISLFAGQDGLWATNQLNQQRQQISARTAQIVALNEELHTEYTALQQDYDVISAYARKLDFVLDNEKLVKISGLPPLLSLPFDPGTPLKRTEITFIPEWICKLSGIIVACLTFIFLSLISYENPRRQKSGGFVVMLPHKEANADGEFPNAAY